MDGSARCPHGGLDKRQATSHSLEEVACLLVQKSSGLRSFSCVQSCR